jgi:hypothetical protein
MNQKSATFVSTKESFQEAVISATNQLNDFLIVTAYICEHSTPFSTF